MAAGAYSGTKFANVFHVKYAGTSPSAADLATFNGSFGSALGTNLCAGMNTGAAYTEITSTDLSSTTGAKAVSAISHAGLVTPYAGLSANVAVCVSWLVSNRYRGGHPRTYIVGQDSAAMVDVAHWSTTKVTNAQSQANAFLAAVNAITLGGAAVQLGYLQQFANKIWLTTPTFHPFTAAVVHNRIDSQRRRLGKEAY